MAQRTGPILVLLLAAALTGGCSRYKSPTFTAISVEPAEQSEDALVLVFTIESTNPNDEPIPLRKASYTLLLDGTPVFRGDRSPETTLGKFNAERFELPAVIPLDQAPDAGTVRYEIRGTVTYQTPGSLADVLFDAGIIVPTAPLRVGGNVNFGG